MQVDPCADKTWVRTRVRMHVPVHAHSHAPKRTTCQQGTWRCQAIKHGAARHHTWRCQASYMALPGNHTWRCKASYMALPGNHTWRCQAVEPINVADGNTEHVSDSNADICAWSTDRRASKTDHSTANGGQHAQHSCTRRVRAYAQLSTRAYAGARM